MDPQETLKQLETHLDRVAEIRSNLKTRHDLDTLTALAHSLERAAECVDALNEWTARGGFWPGDQ